jgi:hemolysin III
MSTTTHEQRLSKDNSRYITDERVNTITALVGSFGAVLGAAVLVVSLLSTGAPWYVCAAVGLYSAALVNMYVMSTLHHALSGSQVLMSVFRTLDYTAIFWVIVGTLGCVIALRFQTTLGAAVFGGALVIASAGTALRASLPKLDRHVTNTFFIALGWLPPLFLVPQLGRLPALELWLLALGGALYSIGFWVYVREKPNVLPGVFGFHETWHCLVLAASAAHFIMVYTMLV